MQWESYDVVVVGAGHAGAEAAMAASRLGAKTLLLTLSIDTICQMSCNPAMGGVAKGQIVREVDAMGGYSGIVTDRTTLQFRMLNRSKGPAMWSPRAQCDKYQFSSTWRHVLECQPNLSLWQDEAVEIIVEGGVVVGVKTKMGIVIPAKAVVLTNGTFLNGKIYVGDYTSVGGRIGEFPSVGLSSQLHNLGFEVCQLKTGTPMRIDARTIDFEKLEKQCGDEAPQKFSFSETVPVSAQHPCYLAYTNSHTHDILKTGFDRSPLYTGRIRGRGPRYCPSIEDKIVRFSDKERHQLFVEPECATESSYYLNGFSSSLPLEVQLEALHSMVGFEQARIIKPGYAIEYDYFSPTQLSFTLETKTVENLYFAGQINGTTGYEEAACQGLVAGANAVLKLKGRPPLVLNRTQAYVGVLIDDLVTKGVDEPYRMFTSRAEYRILLRQDNADERLTPLAYDLGLVSAERMRRVESKIAHAATLFGVVDAISIAPTEANPVLEARSTPSVAQRVKASSLILRPELCLADVENMSPEVAMAVKAIPDDIRAEVRDAVEIQLKYNRYIEKERDVAERILKFEELAIPHDIDFQSMTALSFEAREKLTRMRPQTVGQASRISGVSPSDVAVLIVAIGRH